jgi:DNA-directed RNA polymerase subunit beta'
MDSKGIEDVLGAIAREDPDSYSEVTKRLMDIGNAAAFDTGTTIRLSDLRPAYDKRPILQALDIAEAQIRNDKSLTDAQKSEMIEKLYDKANIRIMEETYNSELERKNLLALQVASKARGNKTQLAAFISTPGTYSDPSGKMVPMFIRHSFAEGLSPAEYWAGSFGARTGVVSTKTATAKGGAFGKLLSASAIAQVVTEEDCETDGGLPVKVDDDDNIGAVLARPAGGYEAGTVITKNVLSDLRKDKRHDEIVVRSPVTCGCKDGVCSKCAGIRETGGLPPIGYNLGTNAASAFAERITQGALNVKHSGKKTTGKGAYQGFNMFTSLANVPKVFPDRATISSVDGTVSKIEEAPQGGTYIFVTDQKGEEKRHYVAPGYELEVKVGDELEAGDQMSDGVIDPSELVKYKGIGEARRYWANRFTQAIRDSGMAANRRNAEVLARTVMNTVRLNNEDEAGEGLPGDVVTYTRWSNGFKPRSGSSMVAPTVASIGKFLEQPVLHYTIGTRITPSVIKTMKKFKVDRMMVNDTQPDVTPFMERIEDSNAEKPDWMARLGTTYLKSRLQEDVARGAKSHLHSTEPYPGIAKGVEFGDWGQPLSKNKSEHFTY